MGQQLQQAFVATVLAETGLAGSSSLTATVNITAEWERYVPFRAVQAANVSAGPEIRVYRSTDGGNNFDSEPAPQFVLTRGGNSDNRLAVRLDTGQYAIELVSGGPNTATLALLTQYSVTSVVG